MVTLGTQDIRRRQNHNAICWTPLSANKQK